ncbi:MAG: hypothetical protein JWO19_4425 [Bryobacterales bacterium]|nr:hypothetical protein [Bryobacterales bacterium]
MRFGFVGPSYKSASPLVSAEELINWYVEQAESPNSRTAFALLPTPGLALFANLSLVAGVQLPSVRWLDAFSGRTFAVAGTHLFELNANGTVTDYGGNPATANNNIVDDGLPVTVVAGGTVGGTYPSQLLIASGGNLTVFSLASNSFQALSTPPTNVLMVEFLDGFFIALSAGNTWSVSSPEDATTWPGIAVAQVSVFSDQLLALIASNRLLWVFGAKRAVAYYNSGAPLFPFDVVSGGFMEVGVVAQYSPKRVATKGGTTVLWLGGDERGATGIVYAANGFVPQRVSDHALEYWLSQQTTISDAVGMARQDQGHNFYDLWFPSANATWTLDVDLGFWHRRTSLVAGRQQAHLSRSHTFAFGQHLVGDRNSGNVYAMSTQYSYEQTAIGASTPIIRTRIGPTVESEGGQLTVPINEFQVDFETGLGPQPPLTDAFGNPRDPMAMFSYSEDYGKTWTPERMIACGQAGDFKAVAVDSRLGSWRSWTPKVTVSDPIPWRIADAYVNGTQDAKPRYSKQIAAVS